MERHQPVLERFESEFEFELYQYDPSLPAAIISAGVFAILTGLHTWRLVRAQAYYFTAFIIGGLCESTPSARTRLAATPAARLPSFITKLRSFSCSADHRLLRADLGPLRQVLDRRLCRPGNSHPRCPCALCRLDLHDSGPPHANHPRRASVSDPC